MLDLNHEKFNIWMNIAVGVLGTIYVLSTWYFRFIVAILRRPGRSLDVAEHYADGAQVLFSFIICLSIAIAGCGLVSLLSNLIHFDYPCFFNRIALDIMVMFMPLMNNESYLFFFYELIFCGVLALYINYLYINKIFEDL